ncbi:MAG: hypothetical protein ACRC2T_11205 [Thermoguttaceae bacterium]
MMNETKPKSEAKRSCGCPHTSSDSRHSKEDSKTPSKEHDKSCSSAEKKHVCK